MKLEENLQKYLIQKHTTIKQNDTKASAKLTEVAAKAFRIMPCCTPSTYNLDKREEEESSP